MNDIFAKDLSGEMISPDEPGYDELITDILLLFVAAEIQVCIVVGIQQISVELLLNHQVRNGQFGLAFIYSADGQHSEIVEQAYKIVRIGDADGRETFLQFIGDIALTH